MESQTKTRMSLIKCIKYYADSLKNFAKALVGGEEELVNGVNNIPDLDEYKNKNANDQEVQKDIERLAEVQKALNKKAQARSEQKNKGTGKKGLGRQQITRGNGRELVEEEKEREF